jgi:hypothetical protein
MINKSIESEGEVLITPTYSMEQAHQTLNDMYDRYRGNKKKGGNLKRVNYMRAKGRKEGRKKRVTFLFIFIFVCCSFRTYIPKPAFAWPCLLTRVMYYSSMSRSERTERKCCIFQQGHSPEKTTKKNQPGQGKKSANTFSDCTDLAACLPACCLPAARLFSRSVLLFLVRGGWGEVRKPYLPVMRMSLFFLPWTYLVMPFWLVKACLQHRSPAFGLLFVSGPPVSC